MKSGSASSLLAAVLLMFVMIPVSARVVHGLDTVSAHRDTSETFTLAGTLTGVEDAKWTATRDTLWMFPRDAKVYRITLQEGEARYSFYAALPEVPVPLLGKRIALKYNYLRNVFGKTISVEQRGLGPLPLPKGTPIYGEITRAGS